MAAVALPLALLALAVPTTYAQGKYYPNHLYSSYRKLLFIRQMGRYLLKRMDTAEEVAASMSSYCASCSARILDSITLLL